MAVPSFSQARDIIYGTWENIIKKEPPLANYAYVNYRPWNMGWKNNVQLVGRSLDGRITLDSEGNAKAAGFYDADSLIRKNIDYKYTVPWRRTYTGMLVNQIEIAINANPLQIYDDVKIRHKSCVKDLIELMWQQQWYGPTSSSDELNPYAFSS